MTVAGAIDREAAASYDIEVTATSTDGSTSVQTYTINVNDIDEFDVTTPSDANVGANTVSEDAANGTAVGITASASDGDATNSTVTYTLVDSGGDPVVGGAFAVDANTGVVTVADSSQLDYESATSHTIYVKATSADGSTSQQSFTVDLTNAWDETPTDITPDSTSVNEGAVAGTQVATLGAVDADAGDTFSYALVNDPSGFFEVVGDHVYVKAGANIDYETATSHDVTVEVTDAGGNSYQETITINVIDLNESGVGAISDSNAAIDAVDENASVGTTVGITAFADDTDVVDTVTYSLSDDAGGLFAIDANTGVVTVAGAIDREAAASYDIEVTATSTDGSTSVQTYTINVNDIDEFDVTTPSDANVGANTVSEDAANGTAVGITASASDGDATNSTVTYTLVDSGGDPVVGGAFAVDANTGVVTVADSSQLDYESATSHTIYVKATSADGSTSQQSFIVNLTDADEYDVGAYRTAMPRRMRLTRMCRRARLWGSRPLASDADSTDTVTYSLSDDAGGLFAIDANTGVVTVAGALDAETAQNHTIEVTATSSDGSTSTQSFNIAVNDLDEFNISATTDNDGTANSVAESASVGTAVGVTALASDADVTDTVTYSLSSNPGGFFAIDANTGVVTVVNALDYESGTSHIIEVTSTSADGSTSVQSFTIDVTDVDEHDVGAVSDTDGTANAVNENVSVGTAVGITASASDADGTDTVTYSLSDDAGGLFAIDANSGVVTVAGAIDREAAASYDIEVTATSTDGSTSVQTYTINVNDIDEFDVTTPTDSNAGANTVSEDAANGTAVGITASASDADATNSSVTYALVDGDGDPIVGGPFAVDANTGVVTVADASLIDYEGATSHLIEVTATSTDGSSQSVQSFNICRYR